MLIFIETISRKKDSYTWVSKRYKDKDKHMIMMTVQLLVTQVYMVSSIQKNLMTGSKQLSKPVVQLV